MSDGVRLAADLYLPARPSPVILEALPYRKDDITSSYIPEYRRLRDEGGYAVARVDLRGTGSSEGLATDEYPHSEQRDLCEVIAWLADQDFCTGNVGMYGTSYSGFNSIQVAMERPEALKAIIAIYATDDRYTDDVHYEGGALRGLDQIDYCLYMTAMNALPAVPSIAGDQWLDQWKERVDKLEPWIIKWLEQQNYGDYWRHGSLRESYDSIQAATMIVAGWADGYRNATFRAFEKLQCPKRLLIGPWAHASTETSLPGPHIDLVPEMIKWWDRWLREEPSADKAPPITLFVRRSTMPAPDLTEMRGEWRHESTWPPERLTEEVFELPDAAKPAGQSDRLEVRADVGWTAHLSCAGVLPWGQPQDQLPDEAYSLVYDWGPFDEDLEILGYPHADLVVGADKPVAFASAKLCDVFEDGTSALVSRGFLNLTHRGSHSAPEALVPGRLYDVGIDLSATSWVLSAATGFGWPSRGRIGPTYGRHPNRSCSPSLRSPPGSSFRLCVGITAFRARSSRPRRPSAAKPRMQRKLWRAKAGSSGAPSTTSSDARPTTWSTTARSTKPRSDRRLPSPISDAFRSAPMIPDPLMPREGSATRSNGPRGPSRQRFDLFFALVPRLMSSSSIWTSRTMESSSGAAAGSAPSTAGFR